MAYVEENIVEESNKATDKLLTTQSENQRNMRKRAWFLDSGCSNHMSGDKELFSTLNDKFKHSVKLGNDKRMKVSGKGNVRLVLHRKAYTISDVYYVPELKNNLLSIGQFQDNNLTVIMQKGMCKIYHEEKGLIAESMMRPNRTFILFDQSDEGARPREQRCLQITTEEMPKLWHERYGHISHRGMRTLQRKDMVRGFPNFDAKKFTCSDCLIGKQPRNPIPNKSSWRAKETLELIHSDICGPINPISTSGKRYILCFIDDYSRKA